MNKIIKNLKFLNFFKIEIAVLSILVFLCLFIGNRVIKNQMSDVNSIQNKIEKNGKNLLQITEKINRIYQIDDSIQINMLNNIETSDLINNISIHKDSLLSLVGDNILKCQLDSLFIVQIQGFRQFKYNEVDLYKNIYKVDTVKSKTITYTKTLFGRKKSESIKLIKFKKLNETELKSKNIAKLKNDQDYYNYYLSNLEIRSSYREVLSNYRKKLIDENENNLRVLLIDYRSEYQRYIKYGVLIILLTIVSIILLIRDINKIIRNSDRKESTIQELIDFLKRKRSI